jgi:hypothetical protein
VSAQQTPAPGVRSNVSVVVVDVGGARSQRRHRARLTAGDFELREDNRPQQIRSFDFEEVTTTAPAATPASRAAHRRRRRVSRRRGDGEASGTDCAARTLPAGVWSYCCSI